MTLPLLVPLMKRVPPSHRPWNAHGYQKVAVDHLLQTYSAALFLDPGLGKTSIVLKAFDLLRSAGKAKRMLVIAPLRVCQTVWRQEAQKWTDFRHLTFCLLHGPRKEELLRVAKADIYLINPEGVAWLAQRFMGRSFAGMFDIVVIDELTKFKNSQAIRSKRLRPKLKGVKARWGLTGTPAPNGYMDLFGQFLVLDDGAALGRFITYFRDTYFQIGFDGFSYDLKPGSDKRIEARIRPYVLRMSDEDYLSLPPLVQDIRYLDMDEEAQKKYRQLEANMITELPGGVVTAANSGAVYSKLKQMANGAIYHDDHKWEVLHNIKLEAVGELVEELAGQQLLLAYEFNHDIARLREHFGAELAVLRSGATERETQQITSDWNAGRIRFLACHPASAAHGLNLQESACAHLAWFGPIWDLELYLQFIRRVRRQGNDAQRIINHLFVMRDTLDEDALDATRDKDTSQTRLLKRLNAILHRAEDPTAGDHAENRSTEMGIKLDRVPPPPPQGQGQPAGHAPASEAGQARVVPRGWAASAASDAPAQDGGQSARTHELLTQGGVPDGASAFSQQVRDHMKEIARAPGQEPFEGTARVVNETAAPAPEKATRRRSAPKANDQGEPQVQASAEEQMRLAAAFAQSMRDSQDADKAVREFAADQSLKARRLELVKLVFAGNDPPGLNDGSEIVRQLSTLIEEG